MDSNDQKIERLDAGLLKAMVLTALKNQDLNSQEIYDHITTVPYSYESSVPALTEKYKDRLYPGSIQALRTALVYLQGRYMIKKTHKKRLLIYSITSLGRKHQKEPFRNEEVFEERVEEEIRRRMRGINVPGMIEPTQDTQQIIAGRVYPDKKIEEFSTLWVGSKNDLVLNCSDDPNSIKLYTLKVLNGIPVLDS